MGHIKHTMLDLITFADELLTKNISEIIMKYVPSYVTKENPESLVSFLALDGYEVLHNDTESFDRQFKKNQREEVSHFIDALQKISLAINENEQGDIQKNVTILDYLEAVKKLAARADSEENK